MHKRRSYAKYGVLTELIEISRLATDIYFMPAWWGVLRPDLQPDPFRSRPPVSKPVNVLKPLTLRRFCCAGAHLHAWVDRTHTAVCNVLAPSCSSSEMRMRDFGAIGVYYYKSCTGAVSFLNACSFG